MVQLQSVGTTCPICLESTAHNTVVIHPCKHAVCIDKVTESFKNCPKCDGVIESTSVVSPKRSISDKPSEDVKDTKASSAFSYTIPGPGTYTFNGPERSITVIMSCSDSSTSSTSPVTIRFG